MSVTGPIDASISIARAAHPKGAAPLHKNNLLTNQRNVKPTPQALREPSEASIPQYRVIGCLEHSGICDPTTLWPLSFITGRTVSGHRAQDPRGATPRRGSFKCPRITDRRGTESKSVSLSFATQSISIAANSLTISSSTLDEAFSSLAPLSICSLIRRSISPLADPPLKRLARRARALAGPTMA